MTREEQMMDLAKSAESNSRTIDLSKKQVFMSAYIQGWKDADSHPQWIPVEEELPKRMNENSRFSKTVLVYNKDGYKDTAYYDFQEKIWKWMPSITHWMPIVPPRKED